MVRLAGKFLELAINEWYLATFTTENSEVVPSNNFPQIFFSWEIFPCIGSIAFDIVEPKYCAINWCPKQTPRKGILPTNFLKTFNELPVSSGRPGPGPITIPMVLLRSIASSCTELFRSTWIFISLRSSFATQLENCWYRFQVNESKLSIIIKFIV